MPNFERFSRELVSLKPRPAITVQKRGLVSVNRPGFEALGGADAVELLYDRAEHILGLRPADRSVSNAYQLRRTASPISGPWVVSAMAFVRFYGIDVSTSRRWCAYLEDGVLCADLATPGTPVTSNRARHRP